MPEIIEENLIFDKNIHNERRNRKRKARRLFFMFCLFLFISAMLFVVLVIESLAKPTVNFPINTKIEITPGMNVQKITEFLEEKNVVQSSLLLYLVFLLQYNSSEIKASTYYFETPQNVYQIADTLVKGDFSAGLMKLTHIEGESVADIAPRAKVLLDNFDSDLFIILAKPLEGKLFPDTYFIPKTFTEKELIETMQKEYEKNLTPVRPLIASSTLDENAVIILASILEREANSPESMKIVAGILENRLKIGMPLQLDASLEYILNKPLSELTAADLDLDSPYNTYKNRGLPPTPIGNPGLTSIMAILDPTPSDYFYYITDTTGNFHYAKTFEEHKKNVAKYLK